MTTYSDETGSVWSVTEHPSGVQSRVLVEPSQEYLDKQEALEEQRQAEARQRAILALPDRIAELRWQHETSGTTFNGIPLATDRESRAMMDGALMMLTNGPPNRTVRWKGKDRTFFEVDRDSLQAINEAVWEHVEACFDRERELLEAIEDAEDPLSVDIEAGWP